MKKVLFATLLGGVLGVFDGLTSLMTPEVRDQLGSIVIGSTFKGLVAGALILYPRYLDPVTRLPCGPEVIVERLDQPELWRPGLLVLARRLQGALARRLSEMRASLMPNGLPRHRLRQ